MAKRRQSQWWKQGNLTNRTPEADQLKYDRGYQRMMSQNGASNDAANRDGDWPGKEFGLPRPVEFTQPGPRRPGR